MEPEQEKKKSSVPAPTTMREIITSQKASGNWILQNLGSILKESIQKSLPSNLSIPINEIESLWMTAVTIVYLIKVYKDQQVNWDLVVDKARKWIRKQEKILSINSFDWEEEASKFLITQNII